jgi:mono/diheme cytochrome c family protein
MAAINPLLSPWKSCTVTGELPPGWRFRIPEGDVAGGREAFVKMECFACHNIDGEKFPKKEKDPAKVGPDLSGMGAMHGDRAYFFESLINPNRVIVKGPGYVKEGNSIMPSYAVSMTLQEAVNLVAYLKSLKGGIRWEG